MKTQSPLAGLLAVFSLGGCALLAQDPVNPAQKQVTTAPAKPSVVAPVPVEGKQLPEGKQVNVGGAESDTPGTKAPPTQFPDNDKTDAGSKRRSAYIIGPEDVLLIRVWEQPNLSGQVTVGPDGMISLQLIDEVRADGLTPDQLKGVLANKLKSFIVNPDVNVQLLRNNSRKFIIQGEVNRSGSFPLTGPTTVMEALVNAGGFREFANNKKIYILRTELDPKTKKSETKKYMFNYKEVSHGKHMEQNILVNNGDQIYVP